MAGTGTAKTSVWRWQARFMAEGVEGLLRDKTRPPGQPPVAEDKAWTVVATMLKPPPHEATHWTVRAMARVAGLAVSMVQKIWKVRGLAPYRWRQFKLSNDPAFAEKLNDVIGPHVSPPAHALVLSIDERSQIQALDRTQPGLPLKKGRSATMTDDYKRHGTATLVAALDVLTGVVFGQNMHATGIRSSSASSTPSSATSSPAGWPTSSSTTMPSTSRRRCGPGSIATGTGPSTLHPHRGPG